MEGEGCEWKKVEGSRRGYKVLEVSEGEWSDREW